MLNTEHDRPGLDEQYLSAQNTSDLTVNPDRRTAVDHLIAAGLSANRMGDALNHLRSQWDAADKPPKATEADAVFRAELLFSVLGRGHKGKPDIKRARIEAMISRAAAMRGIYQRLPARAEAMAILTEWAQLRGVDVDLLSPALYHWLNPTCPACEGRGKVTIPDTPVLGKECHHCAGTGQWPKPPGADRVANFLKGCIGKARQDRRNLLTGD